MTCKCIPNGGLWLILLGVCNESIRNKIGKAQDVWSGALKGVQRVSFEFSLNDTPIKVGPRLFRFTSLAHTIKEQWVIRYV